MSVGEFIFWKSLLLLYCKALYLLLIVPKTKQKPELQNPSSYALFCTFVLTILCFLLFRLNYITSFIIYDQLSSPYLEIFSQDYFFHLLTSLNQEPVREVHKIIKANLDKTLSGHKLTQCHLLSFICTTRRWRLNHYFSAASKSS